MSLRQYFHPPAIAAGFTAVLIGYTGSAVIIFQAAMSESSSREAAIITFIVTASGLTLFGIGAAFWGLVAGGIASFIFSRLKP